MIATSNDKNWRALCNKTFSVRESRISPRIPDFSGFFWTELPGVISGYRKTKLFYFNKKCKMFLWHSSAHALLKIGKCTLCQGSKKNVPYKSYKLENFYSIQRTSVKDFWNLCMYRLHNEAQIVNFCRWSNIPDVHFCPKLRVLDSQSSSLEYTIHGYK